MPGSDQGGHVHAHLHAAARYGARGMHAKAHRHVLRAWSLSNSFGLGSPTEPHVQEPEYRPTVKLTGVATGKDLAAIPIKTDAEWSKYNEEYKKKNTIKPMGVATEKDLAAIPIKTAEEWSKYNEEYKKKNTIRRYP